MERQDRLLCSRSEQWEQRVTFKLYQVFDFRFASDFQRLLIASSASSIFQYFHFEIVSHFRFASDFNFAPSAAQSGTRFSHPPLRSGQIVPIYPRLISFATLAAGLRSIFALVALRPLSYVSSFKCLPPSTTKILR